MSVSVRNLSFGYGERCVLRDISFQADAGRLISILGPNGVGKSTLFKCVLGLLKPSSGSVAIDGQDISSLPPHALARRIAYIPQSTYPAFHYTVFDMVLMGTSSHVSGLSSPGKAQREAAMEALARLNIQDFAGRDYMRISGGERQLVLIARALAQRSRTLVMDEPTANLDYGNQMRVLTSIRTLAEEGYAVILSTHNPEQAYLFSHTILAMQGGGIVAQGAPRDVLDAALIERLYGVEATVESLLDDTVRVCVPTRTR